MVANIDYTSASTQFTFDLNYSPFFKKDDRNFINILGVAQLNTLENVSLLDIFLSVSNVVEPHYHQNAAELVYCISGAITVSMLNPFTKNIQNYTITPGQVVNIPQGWWHYEMATADNTHILAIFDAPTPQVILGSDILKFTPANIMAHTYCLDETKWREAIAPVQPSTYIGPYANCQNQSAATAQPQASPSQPYLQPYYLPQYQQYWGYR
ncbi:cupin domain-containing protein [Brevibacillus fulvus]|uniref:Quercetin dioxygenase-like cupin family protein n=1 Tax=Brevibacillus fulvus TaxID=1125967 RepID=A0A938Y0Z2_9BACL|nr:cupin domain-containing protein [Brevibacillus fulvus]MBM7589587.1 quercetin dioxygenase-like cupin family protein [Brevibacillus fulvus]